MNFEELLDPYKDGGTSSNYTRRTLGVILDWLVNKKKYPVDIVGAAVFQVFFWLSAGNEFLGDGKFGSKGRELDTSIRLKCDELLRIRLENETRKAFIDAYAEELLDSLSKQEVTLSNRIDNYASFKRSFLEWWTGRNVFA